MADPSGKLDEFDEDEWWDIIRRLRPDLTREEHEQLWEEFQEWKRKRQLQ